MKYRRQPIGSFAPIAIAAAALLALLISPFFGVVFTAILLAYSFLPVYKHILRKITQPAAAAALTFFTASAVVIVPIVVILGITASQAATLAQDISINSQALQSGEGIDGLMQEALSTIERLSGGLVQLNEQDIASYGASIGSEVASAVVGLISNIATSAPAFFSGVILFIYLFLALLVYHQQLLVFLRSINPLSDEVFDVYIRKASAMTDGMVKGQFLIALAQGAIGALSFAIAGIPYVAFFFVILSFLSIIPLGSGIISIPLGIILLFTGNIWQGLLILLVHFIVVGNIDNILRPVLIPKEARLPSALLMLGVFSGLYWFGFLGLFIGPIILILALTTLQLYSNLPASASTSSKHAE